MDSDVPYDAVVSRAGKEGGKHETWLNLEYVGPESMAGKRGAVDFRNVDHWEDISEHQEADTAFTTDLASLNSVKVDEKEFHDAKLEEIASWEKNEVFQEVPYEGQPLIGTIWVLTVKNGNRRKARLVAEGFQDADSDSIVKFSPTSGRNFFR